jgi:hypothetical protein
VLAYLEALCSALKARDALAIGELLRHPLATALPAVALEEAQRIAAQPGADHLAPLHTLRLYHQTAHLLGACSDPATRRRTPLSVPVVGDAAGDRVRQMDLFVQAAVA